MSVRIYMDERQTRENLFTFYKLIEVVCPFLLINDFRIANQQNALQRSDCLMKIIQKL